MTMHPGLSVIIPAHNAAKTIERCVASVLAQSHAELEVIVVDDGSLDNTGDRIEALREAEPRIRLVKLANGGVSRARNAGLFAAQGEYVTFIDADDWIECNMAAAMLAAASDAQADIVVAGYFVDSHDSDDKLTRSERRLPGSDWINGMAGMRMPSQTMVQQVGYVWNKLYRRAFVVEGKTYFNPELSLYEDLAFNRALFSRTNRTTFLGDAFTHYVQRPGQSLGSRHRPNSLDLRLQSIKDVVAVFTDLGAAGPRLEELSATLQKQAVLTELKRLVFQSAGARGAAKKFFERPDVREILTDKRGIKNLGALRSLWWRALASRPSSVARLFFKSGVPRT